MKLDNSDHRSVLATSKTTNSSWDGCFSCLPQKLRLGQLCYLGLCRLSLLIYIYIYIYLGRRCPLKTFCDIQKTTNTIDSVYEYHTDESEVPKTAKIIKRSQVGSMDFIAVSSARATDTSLVGLGFACKSISLLAFVPGNNLISDSGILFGFGSRWFSQASASSQWSPRQRLSESENLWSVWFGT